MYYYKEHLYNFLKLIPYGKVVSYSQLGEIFGVSPRGIAKVLSENTELDTYPCYKVVNKNGKIGGYNQGEAEKIEKLQNEGVKITGEEVDPECFRSPVFRNFFAGFPLRGSSKESFGELICELKKLLGAKNFVFQKTSSPHITLKFFGSISLKEMHNIKDKVLRNKEVLNFSESSGMELNKIGDFGGKVFFLESFDNEGVQVLRKFHNDFESIVGYTEKREYRPHLTLFKNKKNFTVPYKKVISLLNKYRIFLVFSVLRLYFGVDNFYQVPLIDIDLYYKGKFE